MFTWGKLCEELAAINMSLNITDEIVLNFLSNFESTIPANLIEDEILEYEHLIIKLIYNDSLRIRNTTALLIGHSLALLYDINKVTKCNLVSLVITSATACSICALSSIVKCKSDIFSESEINDYFKLLLHSKDLVLPCLYALNNIINVSEIRQSKYLQEACLFALSNMKEKGHKSYLAVELLLKMVPIGLDSEIVNDIISKQVRNLEISCILNEFLCYVAAFPFISLFSTINRHSVYKFISETSKKIHEMLPYSLKIIESNNYSYRRFFDYLPPEFINLFYRSFVNSVISSDLKQEHLAVEVIHYLSMEEKFVYLKSLYTKFTTENRYKYLVWDDFSAVDAIDLINKDNSLNESSYECYINIARNFPYTAFNCLLKSIEYVTRDVQETNKKKHVKLFSFHIDVLGVILNNICLTMDIYLSLYPYFKLFFNDIKKYNDTDSIAKIMTILYPLEPECYSVLNIELYIDQFIKIMMETKTNTRKLNFSQKFIESGLLMTLKHGLKDPIKCIKHLYSLISKFSMFARLLLLRLITKYSVFISESFEQFLSYTTEKKCSNIILNEINLTKDELRKDSNYFNDFGKMMFLKSCESEIQEYIILEMYKLFEINKDKFIENLSLLEKHASHQLAYTVILMIYKYGRYIPQNNHHCVLLRMFEEHIKSKNDYISCRILSECISFHCNKFINAYNDVQQLIISSKCVDFLMIQVSLCKNLNLNRDIVLIILDYLSSFKYDYSATKLILMSVQALVCNKTFVVEEVLVKEHLLPIYLSCMLLCVKPDELSMFCSSFHFFTAFLYPYFSDQKIIDGTFQILLYLYHLPLSTSYGYFCYIFSDIIRYIPQFINKFPISFDISPSFHVEENFYVSKLMIECLKIDKSFRISDDELAIIPNLILLLSKYGDENICQLLIELALRDRVYPNNWIQMAENVLSDDFIPGYDNIKIEAHICVKKCFIHILDCYVSTYVLKSNHDLFGKVLNSLTGAIKTYTPSLISKSYDILIKILLNYPKALDGFSNHFYKCAQLTCASSHIHFEYLSMYIRVISKNIKFNNDLYSILEVLQHKMNSIASKSARIYGIIDCLTIALRENNSTVQIFVNFWKNFLPNVVRGMESIFRYIQDKPNINRHYYHLINPYLLYSKQKKLNIPINVLFSFFIKESNSKVISRCCAAIHGITLILKYDIDLISVNLLNIGVQSACYSIHVYKHSVMKLIPDFITIAASCSNLNQTSKHAIMSVSFITDLPPYAYSLLCKLDENGDIEELISYKVTDNLKRGIITQDEASAVLLVLLSKSAQKSRIIELIFSQSCIDSFPRFVLFLIRYSKLEEYSSNLIIFISRILNKNLLSISIEVLVSILEYDYTAVISILSKGVFSKLLKESYYNCSHFMELLKFCDLVLYHGFNENIIRAISEVALNFGENTAEISQIYSNILGRIQEHELQQDIIDNMFAVMINNK